MNEWPYDVGPGWWVMLDEKLVAARKIAPDVKLEAKEKYGRCDAYFTTETENREPLYRIEEEIEEQSLKICEFCGQPGQQRTDRSWIQTLCDRCAAANSSQERQAVVQNELKRYFQNQKTGEDLEE